MIHGARALRPSPRYIRFSTCLLPWQLHCVCELQAPALTQLRMCLFVDPHEWTFDLHVKLRQINTIIFFIFAAREIVPDFPGGSLLASKLCSGRDGLKAQFVLVAQLLGGSRVPVLVRHNIYRLLGIPIRPLCAQIPPSRRKLKQVDVHSIPLIFCKTLCAWIRGMASPEFCNIARRRKRCDPGRWVS